MFVEVIRVRRLVLLVIILVVVYVLWPAHRPRVRPGVAQLDLSVYVDPDKDRQAAADVLVRNARGMSPLPNIVVILADDLGYGDLGVYGNTVIHTPNLDRLAQNGVRFTDFYASHSTCSPSRAGLLTGRYPLRTGINFPIQPDTDSLFLKVGRSLSRFTSAIGAADMVEGAQSAVPGLPDSEITLAEALKLAGYSTGMIGKWHLGDFNSRPQYHPQRHGFDFFAGVPHSNDNFPYTYWKNNTVVTPDLGLNQEDLTAELTKEAVGFIDSNRDHPFFLYFAHKNVHTPLFPSGRFAGKSAGGPYGDTVEEMDWSVGEVVRALAERGLLEKTLLFFMSDNGPWHLGNPGLLRGRKGQPMEGGQRVPLIAHWPGKIPAGRTVDAAAMNIDLFPTILRLVGLDLPRDRIIDGRDIWGLLTGEETTSPHDALFFFNANVIDGVRSGPWKYYRWVNLYTWPFPLDKPNTLTGRGARRHFKIDPKTGRAVYFVIHDPLLFDVTRDGNESYNLAEGHGPEIQHLQQLVDAWETDFFANPRGWK